MTDPPLPITRNFTLVYFCSLVVAFLLTGVSLAGLLFQSRLYLTEELRRSLVSNDVTNLVIGLPILLGSLALARRGMLIGLLWWPGALLYIAYNSIAYATAIPLTIQFVIYLTLAILSAFTIFRLLSSLDAVAIQQRLAGAVSERFCGVVLTGLGALFFGMRIWQVAFALFGRMTFTRPELSALIADLLVTPVLVIGGILLWQRRSFGYLTGAGLLFLASMLFIGLLIFFIVQPFLTVALFPAMDFVVVLVMGLVCFIPLGLFTQGILRR